VKNLQGESIGKVNMPKHYKGKTGAAKTKALKEHYAQNPYGPPNSYAGSILTGLKNDRKLTPNEEAEDKQTKNEYHRKVSLLTGQKKAEQQEKEELTKEKKKKKTPNIHSKNIKEHIVYV